MDIPIEIPGLNQFIPSVAGGSVVLLRGSGDLVKTHFAQYLGEMGKKAGMHLVYVTSRGIEEVLTRYKACFNDGAEITVMEHRSPMRWIAMIQKDVVMIVDSFSYLTIDKDMQTFRTTIEDIRLASKNAQAIVVLIVDSEMMTPDKEAVLFHLSDGVIEFHLKETAEGLSRFIRIVRWMGSASAIPTFSTLSTNRG